MTGNRVVGCVLLGAWAGAGQACSPNPDLAEVLLVSEVIISPPAADVTPGQSVQLSAVPHTASGLGIPNRGVTWASSNEAIATVSSSGMVTGITVGGPVLIIAAVDGVEGTAPVRVVPVPAREVIVAPGEASIRVGETVQLQATVLGPSGETLTGRTVTWTSDDTRIATVSSSGMVTGEAKGGPVTIRATSGGRVGTARIVVEGRQPVKLGFLVQPADGTAGQPLGAFEVAVQDDEGGTALDATTSITLTLSTNPAGATLEGTLTRAAVNGVARFTDLRIDRAGTGYELTASASGLIAATSAPFDIASGPATALVIDTQPSATAVSGVPFARQPVIRLVDALGNAVSTAGVAVTAELASGSGVLEGTLTVTTDSDGVARYTDLRIDGVLSGPHTIRFSSPALASVVSDVITVF